MSLKIISSRLQLNTPGDDELNNDPVLWMCFPVRTCWLTYHVGGEIEIH